MFAEAAAQLIKMTSEVSVMHVSIEEVTRFCKTVSVVQHDHACVLLPLLTDRVARHANSTRLLFTVCDQALYGYVN